MDKNQAICLLLSIAAFSLLVDGRRTTVREGDSCSPLHVATCGEVQLVSKVTTEAGDPYGPNVCVTEKTYEVGTYTYQMQEFCNWYFCRLRCSRNNCDGPRVNVTKTKVDCCEGFALSQSSSSHGGHSYHYGRKQQLKREGCPTMLRDTVLDCLEELNLTTFLSELNRTTLEDTLSSPNETLTVFAPSNAAFDDLDNPDLLSDDNIDLTIAAHIVDKELPGKRLTHGSIVSALPEDRCLHITEVDSYTGRGWYRQLVSEHTFINGANVSDKDACLARNGIVHVVDSVIETSPSTITEIIESTSTLSSFFSLLDGANTTDLLDVPDKSRTVFAPVDSAFDSLPEGAVECLQRPENKWALKTLIYIHIGYPAEYTSSLALRSIFPTFSSFYLLVQENDGVIQITRDNITLEETNIPAKNGVIHTIGDVIVPDCIDFDELCPDLPDPQPTPTVLPSPTPDPSVAPPPTPDPDPTVAPSPTPDPTVAPSPTPDPPAVIDPSGSGIDPPVVIDPPGSGEDIGPESIIDPTPAPLVPIVDN